MLAALLTKDAVRGRRVRLLFQDEARFGRMARPKRCWAPMLRPTMLNGYEREFVYVYGGVSPVEGDLDWRICREMNTNRMSGFLGQVSQAHRRDFIIMVLDGASSHKSKELEVPENIRLLPLPPYAPELEVHTGKSALPITAREDSRPPILGTRRWTHSGSAFTMLPSIAKAARNEIP